MNCPRCDDTLVTFALEVSERSAVVCESCGFTGIPASHTGDRREIESWEQAMGRFAEATDASEGLCRTSRTEAITLPAEDSDGNLDMSLIDERRL